MKNIKKRIEGTAMVHLMCIDFNSVMNSLTGKRTSRPILLVIIQSGMALLPGSKTGIVSCISFGTV